MSEVPGGLTMIDPTPDRSSPSPPPLDEEPPSPRVLRPWLFALVGLFAGYPLSVAPVAWICQKLDPGGTSTDFVRMAYLPIKFLYDSVPFVRVFYDWYLGLFGVR